MNDVPARKRVLIIGAGRRGQNSYLPSLSCLADLYEICGIHSRTMSRVVPIARKWNVPSIERLSDIDLSTVDLAVISVPTAQNAAVLQALVPHAGTLRVLIDTPIALNRQELNAVRPLLEQFPEVTVAEDHMNFPFHSLAREAVIQGIIGRPSSVSLFNIGYLYHGLSIIRAFTGFAPATSSWNKSLGTHAKLAGFGFADGFSGAMIGPYRRQEKVAGLVVEGSLGIISESRMDANYIGHNRKMYVLEAVRAEGQLTGYQITGPDYKRVRDLPYLGKLRALDFPDKSEINLIQNCALIDVILSVFHESNINRSYGYKNMLYDSFASQRAENGYHKLEELDFL